MPRWIRFTLLAAAGLVVVAGTAFFGAVQFGERKQHRVVALDVRAVPYADDAASLERGRYLFLSRGCTECHGVEGRGKDVINDGKGMLVHAPNITTVAGGVTAGYREVDWVRLIRHGVKRDGKPAMVMPSEDYARLTDADLAALVAWVRRLPAAEGPGATVQFPLLVRALYGAGAIRDAAEKIDHTLAPPAPVPDAPTAAHGAYVANACIGCHGAALSGGHIPGAPPDWPAAANLTPAADGALAKYPDVAAFTAMLRTGKRPDGSAVSAVMPFAALKELNDTDVQAIWLHLKTLPATATGTGR